MLTNGMVSPELEVIGPSYKAILEPVADRLEEFERYITALHALEIEDRGMESGKAYARMVFLQIKKWTNTSF